MTDAEEAERLYELGVKAERQAVVAFLLRRSSFVGMDTPKGRALYRAADLIEGEFHR